MVDVDPTTISVREAEVLDALGDHLTNAQIAQKLHISVRTVESHVSSLLRKLGAADRRELALRSAVPPVWPAPAFDEPSIDAPQVVGLPATWTTFIGRAAELEELTLALSSNRLVTLVGPGGIGKTRLAVVAAAHNVALFAGGGAFVDLVPVSSEFVLHAVAAALGVVERPQDPLERVVHERFARGASFWCSITPSTFWARWPNWCARSSPPVPTSWCSQPAGNVWALRVNASCHCLPSD